MPLFSLMGSSRRQRARCGIAATVGAFAIGLVLPGSLRAQYVSPAPHVVAKAPGPVSTLFGIPVGAPLSAEPLVPCANIEAARAQRQCDDSNPAAVATALERIGLVPAVLDARGWRVLVVKLNDELAGTALLVGSLGHSLPLDVVVDRQRVVQSVSIPTPASEHDRLLGMLSAKYGKPMRTEATEWLGASAGEAARWTPNYFWDFANVHIAYRSETAPATRALPMATGHIRVALPSFADAMRPTVISQAASQAAPAAQAALASSAAPSSTASSSPR